jgi:hypothetical protein
VIFSLILSRFLYPNIHHFPEKTRRYEPADMGYFSCFIIEKYLTEGASLGDELSSPVPILDYRCPKIRSKINQLRLYEEYLMADLTEKFLPLIQAHRLPDLNLGPDLLYPYYHGHSLLNLPTSICHLFDLPDFGTEPLAPELVRPFLSDYKRIVLFVLDGMGLFLFQNFLRQGLGQVWEERMEQATLLPITSICPSTTSAALTTLWTGAGASAHGITGYEMWLKEYGVVANMISHTPMAFSGDTGGLKRAGFKPETFLPLPVMGQHLMQYGIQSYAFMHHSIARSGLSAMHLQQTSVYSFNNPGDMLVSLRNFLNDKTGEKLYTYVYWGDLDELSHRFGPDDERIAAEFDAFSHIFSRYFLDGLLPSARKETLLLVTADHGQIHTPKLSDFDLRKHPTLLSALHILPTGENRLSFLFPRPGQVDFVKGYVEETWPEKFSIIPTDQVLKSGLLGPGKRHPRLTDRVGDLVAIARGNAYWWWAEKENPLLGRHGGLTPDEMLVGVSLNSWVSTALAEAVGAFQGSQFERPLAEKKTRYHQ